MRILFIIHSITLYGANRSVIDLALQLQKLGNDVFFFIPLEGKQKERYVLKKILDDAGISYIFLDYNPSVHSIQEKVFFSRIIRMKKNQKCLQIMEEYVKLWGIDIIHTNTFTHTIGALLSKRVKKPHVWHIRETLKKDYALAYDSKLLYRYALVKTSRVICISEYVTRTYKKVLWGMPVTVLHNGFNINNYILNGVFQKNPQVFTLMISGTIREEKGQLDAVKAVELLIHKYQVKNIHLIIIGDGVKEYGDQIKSFIKQKKLEDYIEILPFQTELRKIRKHADIALMCSRNEALGRVTIESMLSENIVIGTNSAGTAEIITDGVNGYLYEVGNVEDLSSKIFDVITHWSEQEKIVKKAKEYAKQNYNIEEYTKKILDIYSRLIEENNRKEL